MEKLDPTDGLARFMPALRSYFRRRAHPADIDDLVQDVLLSMQSRASLEPILNIDSYIFTIASHVLARHAKRARRGQDAVQALGVMDLAVDELSPERQTLARVDLDKARRAIEKLPDRTREIFVLHRFEHMTYPEIARHVGVSVSAVEKHIMKATKALLAARGWFK